MYYNTNLLDEPELKVANLQTEKQEEIVRKLFFRYKKMTASQIFRIFPIKNAPITSIRRTLTDLKNEGFLIKTDERIPGIYGSPERYYILKAGQLSIWQ